MVSVVYITRRGIVELGGSMGVGGAGYGGGKSIVVGSTTELCSLGELM